MKIKIEKLHGGGLWLLTADGTKPIVMKEEHAYAFVRTWFNTLNVVEVYINMEGKKITIEMSTK